MAKASVKADENSRVEAIVAPKLTEALAQNEYAESLAADAAEELRSANIDLKQAIVVNDASANVEVAIQKSEDVAQKVREVADKLSSVNRTLQREVRDRIMLDHQFAAVAEQEQAARHAAFHDPLTGLPNRALLMDRLEQAMAMARRQDWSLALMFVDLDGFKEINDTHGHDAGDRVLQMIAHRLAESSRADDTVSRHGGDEFLYLLMKCGDKTVISTIAEKIIISIQRSCEVAAGDQMIKLTVSASIGIAVYPRDGGTADALIKSADIAMYRAKHGESRFAFAEGSSD